jgi:undecaprenyl diphosphate synthase
MKKLELDTYNNTNLLINLQISYGSRQSIIKSVNNLILNNIEVTEKNLSRELTKSLCSYQETMPDPDIVIRTSGETRVSNEMLWEIAYSEIFFIDKLWPEITTKDIDNIVESFKNKERRFGK